MGYTRLLSEATSTPTLGTEPTIIDPATGATRLVADIYPGGNSSYAFLSLHGSAAALAGGLTVFAAIDAANGQELWSTDGTAGGTHLVAALEPGGIHSFGYPGTHVTTTIKGSLAGDFAALDRTRALFTAYDSTNVQRLWVTDGSAAGTRAISSAIPVNTDVSAPTNVVALGDGRAVFAAADPTVGTELWVTDGTAAGTHLVSDLRPGTAPSTPTSFAAFGRGRAIFAAADDAGNAVWITDGTAAGTVRVIGLAAPKHFATLGNGLAVFENTDAAHGSELWVTDGTAAGTQLLSDTVPGSTGGLVDAPVSGFGLLGDGRALFFSSTVKPGGGTLGTGPFSDRQLWITDGTAAGTKALIDFGADAAIYAGGGPGFTSLQDGRVAFYVTPASDAFSRNVTLWVSDGTVAGTHSLAAGNPSVPLGGLSGAQLVDAPFYYGLYGDVATAGVNAAQHYDQSGWHESRDPDAFFSTAGYLNFYKDVKGAGLDPLTHYDANGWKEGRDPSAAFDSTLYLLFNPDVKAAGIDPLQHWLADGQVEGRKMSAVVDSGKVTTLFDPTFYGLGNSDVTSSGADLLTHFNTYGVKEGRNPDAYFDVKYYLQQNPDVAASGINPVAHYFNVGWKEGRDPSTHFSTTKYLAAYADVRAAGVNPLQHFLANGIIEGRSGFGDRL